MSELNPADDPAQDCLGKFSDVDFVVTDFDPNSGHQANQEKSSSIQKPDQTQGEQCSNYDSSTYNPFRFNVPDFRTNLFEEGGNDVPQYIDQYMEPAQHGDQDVLNNSTKTTELTVPELVFPDHLDILRTIVELDLALVVKNPKTDMHSHPADHPDSPTCVLLLTSVHPSGSDEPG
uniref:Uncharacterized protein n=1 Tax=Brassica oleracea var. oleracea TaxID=109376 RepID=A0A0D3ATF0_BRAOL